jgi:hypothetical protein
MEAAIKINTTKLVKYDGNRQALDASVSLIVIDVMLMLMMLRLVGVCSEDANCNSKTINLYV